MASHGTETLGDLALKVQPVVRGYTMKAYALCIGIALWLFLMDKPGIMAFLMIAAGSLMPLKLWVGQRDPGLPLCAMMGVQALFLYGMPIIVGNEELLQFSPSEIDQASVEVMLYGFAMALGWYFTTKNTSLRSRGRYWQFIFTQREGVERLARVAPTLLGASVCFIAANMSGLIPELPTGVFPIFRTLADTAAIGGGMLGGYFLGRGILKGGAKGLFFTFFIAYCVLISANYMLFTVMGLVAATSIGIFIGGGRVPIAFTAGVIIALSILNLSKFEMRSRYWDPGTTYDSNQTLADIPSRYAEWIGYSYEYLMSAEDDSGHSNSQRLSDRITNLANLLIAQNGVRNEGIEPLHGKTYSLIPALLIPRALWPDKPRTHEGMVLLNIHFGRQTLEESLRTYIAWGLLPEAYGNFGPIWGALICGFALGCITGGLERWARIYPLTSLEALVFLLLLVQFATSYETVASLWITSIFQMLVAVIGGNVFFVQRAVLPRTCS